VVRLVVFLCWLRPRARGLLHRGVRKRGGCRSVAGRSYVLIGACPGDLHWRRAQQGVHTSPTEAILKCFSGPFCPRSHRCCASTLAIRNARQPSSAFCCALGGWWLGRCGVAGAPVAHLRGGQEPNVGRGAVYTGIFVGTLATYAPIPAVFFFFLAPFDVRPGPGYAWPRRGSWVPTLIRGLPSRGTPAKKNWPRSEKPCRWAWPLLQPGGRKALFSLPLLCRGAW